MIANFLVAMVCLAVGWAALFPARHSLGAFPYHVAAMPTGVLGWSFVAALTTVIGVPPSALWTVAGLGLYVAVVWLLARTFSAGEGSGVTWRGFAVFGAVYAAAAGLVTASGLTIAGFDSYTHYELSAWYLADTGRLSSILVGSRNTLIPALLMGTRLLGSDWTSVMYPLFSATALGLTGWAAWHLSFAHLGMRLRAGATAALVVVVAVLPTWVFHTFFAHSNMVSAMYLTLAVVGLLAAAGAFSERVPTPRAASAFTLVSGIALAGLSLARPDGLAYAFVGLILAFALHFAEKIDRRAVAALYAGLLIPAATVYAAAIARSGLWTDAKLKASWAVALLVAMCLFGVATVAAPRVRLLVDSLSFSDVVRVVVLADFAIVGLVAIKAGAQFALTVRNMIANLFFAGGWGMTWVVLVVALVIALVFWKRGVGAEWRMLLLLAFVQYMAVALAVHGLTHPGRIKMTDSFNRAALHIVPVAFLFISAYIGSLLRYPDASPATEGRTDIPSSEA